ncbi:hypothetical protein PC110_g17564 [Phytophthora cactorum]|uniref:Uncharacterized protein n=1 Tax=Phytophthora cactorum TaxID=29920 RepID=A0A329RS41_9STRA|nr:hypothetical protein PC110_g17564 [Phytophthora cactorum]
MFLHIALTFDSNCKLAAASCCDASYRMSLCDKSNALATAYCKTSSSSESLSGPNSSWIVFCDITTLVLICDALIESQTDPATSS